MEKTETLELAIGRQLTSEIAALRLRVEVLEAIVEKAAAALEQAKQNPMVANMMRMMGG